MPGTKIHTTRRKTPKWRRIPGVKCNAPTHRSGGKRRCPMLAGWDTGHPGYGRCSSHDTYEERQAWAMAYEVAKELNVSPWESLLVGVRRAAGRVAWVDQQLESAVRRNDGEPAAPEVLRWLQESRKERTLQARMSKAAIDAGVAERMVRQTELEGRLVSEALEHVMDILGLSHEQRLLAIEAASSKLLAPGDSQTTVVQGTVLHDGRDPRSPRYDATDGDDRPSEDEPGTEEDREGDDD